MKKIIGIILLIIVLCFAIALLPLAIGGFIAALKFSEGNVMGGIIAIIIGLLCEVFWWWYITNGEGAGGHAEEECPYCGSGDTDGNHCHTCGGDF